LAVAGVAVAAALVRPSTQPAEPSPPAFVPQGLVQEPPTTGDRNDLVAQSSARNTVAAALTAFADRDTFRGMTPEKLREIEPSLAFSSDASPGPDEPSVAFRSSSVG